MAILNDTVSQTWIGFEEITVGLPFTLSIIEISFYWSSITNLKSMVRVQLF